MIGVRLEERIPHGADPRVRLELTGDVLSRAGHGIDAEAERLESFEQGPRIERAEARAGVAQEVLKVFSIEPLGAQHRTAERSPLPVDVLGRRIHHDVGAEFEGVLEHGRGEDVVDDHERTGGVGQLGDSDEINDLETRIGGRLEKDRLSTAGEGSFPLGEITPIDKDGLDAKAGQDVGDDHRAAAEQGTGGNDLVAGLQERCHGGEHCCHATCRRAADVRTFDQAKALLEHRDGGVAVAAVDIAVDVAGEGRFRLLRRRVHETGGRVDGLGRLVETASPNTSTDKTGRFGPVVDRHVSLASREGPHVSSRLRRGHPRNLVSRCRWCRSRPPRRPSPPLGNGRRCGTERARGSRH